MQNCLRIKQNISGRKRGKWFTLVNDFTMYWRKKYSCKQKRKERDRKYTYLKSIEFIHSPSTNLVKTIFRPFIKGCVLFEENGTTRNTEKAFKMFQVFKLKINVVLCEL